MLDFCLLSRYAKRDKLYYEYKWLWRHFLKLLNSKQRHAVTTPWVNFYEDSTIPIRYLAFVTELKTRQVVAFFHHFESHTRIIRPGHTMNSKKYRVFAGDAIRFLNDMSSMEMLSINKDFCMNS